MPVTTLRAPRPAAAAPREGLITLEDAAIYLQIKPGTLRHWVHEGRIEYVRIGKFARFTREALDRYIASQTVSLQIEIP